MSQLDWGSAFGLDGDPVVDTPRPYGGGGGSGSGVTGAGFVTNLENVAQGWVLDPQAASVNAALIGYEARMRELENQYRIATEQGDLNRANAIRMQQADIQAKIQLQREQLGAEASGRRDAAKYQIYGGAAGLATRGQIERGIGMLDESANNYRGVIGRGGILTPEQVAEMEAAGYNDVNDSGRQSGIQLNNDLAARGQSANVYGAQVLGRDARYKAAANRGRVRAGIIGTQADSLLASMGALTGINTSQAGLATQATQEGALAVADSLPGSSPMPWETPPAGSGGGTGAGGGTGGGGSAGGGGGRPIHLPGPGGSGGPYGGGNGNGPGGNRPAFDMNAALQRMRDYRNSRTAKRQQIYGRVQDAVSSYRSGGIYG